MDMVELQRRQFLTYGSGALAGLAIFHAPFVAWAFPSRPGEKVLPWADQPPANPVPEVVRNQLKWEELNSWLTPKRLSSSPQSR